MDTNNGPSSFRELRQYVRYDLRYISKGPFRDFLSRYFYEAGFRYVFWLRITRYFFLKGKKTLIPFFLSRMVLKHYGYKYSFDISYRAQIGPRLTIPHFGYIIVTSNTLLGKGCTLRPGVVFGKKLTAETQGAQVGDYVNIGVGAKIIGAVHIGSNVTIGANSVVTKDIPSDCIIAGAPAKVIRYKRSSE